MLNVDTGKEREIELEKISLEDTKEETAGEQDIYLEQEVDLPLSLELHSETSFVR